MSRRSHAHAQLTEEQRAALDEEATAVDLRALDYVLSPADARYLATLYRETPEVWACRMADTLRCVWEETRRAPFPYTRRVVARAIVLNMRSDQS